MDYNACVFVGRVVRQPELKQSNTGTPICNITVATNETWKDKATGEKRKETQFHDCVAYGKLAEVIANHVIKGQEILVQGPLKHRSWDKPDGTKGYASNIVINTFQFGSKPQGEHSDLPKPEDYSTTLLGPDGKLADTKLEDLPF